MEFDTMENSDLINMTQQLEAMGEKALRAARELALLSAVDKVKPIINNFR